MKPTLLIISFSEIAKDARVLKQVREFSESYHVTTCGFGESPLASVEHLRVDTPAGGAARGILRFPLAAIDLVAAKFRVFPWIYARISYVGEARRLLKGRHFDVALANDVDTIALAIDVAGRDRVHADLHEFFPGIHDNLTALSRRQTAYLSWLVRRYAAQARSATTVSEGIARAYLKYGLDCGVVTNATPRYELSPTAVGSTIRLVHSGNAQPSRQLELIMRAAAETASDVTLDLYLMPNDTVYLSELKRLAAELGPRIRIRDPLPQSELVEALNAYDVGIHVLPPTSFNNANALPNKFFDYVQSRLGLIIGPSPEMARTLLAHGFGAVSADFSVTEIRTVMDDLTPARVESWKLKSHLAAEPLSADSQVKIWAAAIDTLAAR
ncbi:glycosyltransferase family 1 protein [Lacisediminihabitans sp. H27-G8]|uniref:glycosyltransferase family 1 protein n=1 Tax=Lacisediminihabitans sp. H27-G8 TaxID=3111909 RepID=UPI0038FCE88B